MRSHRCLCNRCSCAVLLCGQSSRRVTSPDHLIGPSISPRAPLACVQSSTAAVVAKSCITATWPASERRLASSILVFRPRPEAMYFDPNLPPNMVSERTPTTAAVSRPILVLCRKTYFRPFHSECGHNFQHQPVDYLIESTQLLRYQ